MALRGRVQVLDHLPDISGTPLLKKTQDGVSSSHAYGEVGRNKMLLVSCTAVTLEEGALLFRSC